MTGLDQIEIREAKEEDAQGIRDVFLATYGADYVFQQFYEIWFLKRMIFGDDALMFVAVERNSGRILGTASVLLEIGAFSDLIGEFGRLAVLPEERRHHIGSLLMEARLRAIHDRLHAVIVEARTAHPYSIKIAYAHEFAICGFLPLRHQFAARESVCVLARWFDDSRSLRRNNPRIIPEVQPIAAAALSNAQFPVDVIVDSDAPAYPHESGFTIEELTTRGYSNLLRIERGRVRRREVFGPMRLHYGFFKLRQSHAEYLLARDAQRIAGAVGFFRDDHDKSIRIFELITPDDLAARFLLADLVRRAEQEWGTCIIEVDVRATAPQLQRTLIELGFVPAAYIPAMVFHEVERFDVVRMIRLFAPPDLGDIDLTPEAASMCDLVMRPIRKRHVTPRIRESMPHLEVFNLLTDEQADLLASACTYRRFEDTQSVFRAGEKREALYLILSGAVDVTMPGNKAPVGRVSTGEALAETGLLQTGPHRTNAIASGCVEAAVLEFDTFDKLARRRPDIGLVLYRQLGKALAEKLHRADTVQARVSD